ncbi:uncharacterized protein LOC128187419 [Crassostrea angulata]|uniref:uncharacterized protein LOC128187419 n=1 Tax=Magallana angulata TaxID=2784310 RepID=UPI0022B102A4|nr:uncharacterized protein LOC128187419 [Crassostrea angulata]
MPKRKVREAPPAPRAKPRDRKRVATDSSGSDGPQHSVNLVDLSGPQNSANLVDFSTSPNLNRETMSTQKQPPALNREQLDEVTQAVIAAMSSRTETSHHQNEMNQDASAEYPGQTAFQHPGALSYLERSQPRPPMLDLLYLRVPEPPKQSTNIDFSSIAHSPREAMQAVNKELILGRVAVPFVFSPLPNLRLSPVGMVPKKKMAHFDSFTTYHTHLDLVLI